LISYYMNLIPLPFMETLNHVINIAKEDRRWKCCHKIKHDLMRLNSLYVFFNLFGAFYPLCKYEY
jgi:hypothetical protein